VRQATILTLLNWCGPSSRIRKRGAPKSKQNKKRMEYQKRIKGRGEVQLKDEKIPTNPETHRIKMKK
jgi:hypothetical protein